MLALARKLPDLFHRYGAPVAVENIALSPAAVEELGTLSGNMPMDWHSPNLSGETRTYISGRKPAHDSNLDQDLKNAKRAYAQNGVCIISLGDAVEEGGEEALKRQLVYMLSALGKPFGVFHQKGFWQTLGVNENAMSLRAESTGYIPLHIDFDQAANPPDGVALFCARPDPMGGGQNLVFDYQRFLNMLSDDDRMALSGAEYSYSTLYAQNGIGDLYNPHPLLERRDGLPSFFRYNGKAQPELKDDLAELFMVMEACFRSVSAAYTLKKGDLLIVDQNKTLHGREALANPEGYISPDRLLWQTYLRHEC